MLSECRRWCRKAILALDEVNRGTQRELTLQASLAMSSMFARGDSEEVNNALERGIALAQGLRDTEQLPHLLAGLNLFRMAAAGVSRGHYFGFDHELWACIGLARTFWLRGFPIGRHILRIAASSSPEERASGHAMHLPDLWRSGISMARQ